MSSRYGGPVAGRMPVAGVRRIVRSDVGHCHTGRSLAVGVRDHEPLRLSAGFWARVEVREALLGRDLNRLFRLVFIATGASQTRLGLVVGMEQGRVSKVINGRLATVSMEVYERVADGLDMPDDARVRLGLAPLSYVFAGRDPRHALPDVHPEPTAGSSAAMQHHPQGDGGSEGNSRVPLALEDTCDPLERLAALTDSVFTDQKIGQMDQILQGIIDSYEGAGPRETIPRIVRQRTRLVRGLSGFERPRHKEAIYRQSAKLAGMLAYAAVNLGQLRVGAGVLR